MRHLLLILLLSSLLVGPVTAQEDPPPLGTAPVIIEDSSGDSTEFVAVPVPVVVEDPAEPFAIHLDWFLLLGVLALLVIQVVQLIQSGKTPDEALTERIAAVQDNRQAVEAAERRYQEGVSSGYKQGLDAAIGILGLVAPLTGLNFDDKLKLLLEDIRTPGPPVTPPPEERKVGTAIPIDPT